MAQLPGAILERRRFVNCDLSGANLTDSNLDFCTFENCDWSEITLDGSSLVNVDVTDTSSSNVGFDGATLRSVMFTRCQLSNVVAHRSVLSNVGFVNCDLSGWFANSNPTIDLQINDSRVTDVTFEASRGPVRMVASRSDLSQFGLVRCEIKRLELDDLVALGLDLSGSVVERWNSTGCRILQPKTGNIQVIAAAHDGTTFAEARLDDLAIERIDLSRCHLTQCVWPDQEPNVGFFGGYQRAPQLMGTPVQDISGISSRLRRQIADAQFLDSAVSNRRGLVSRTSARVWGASTKFGQSITRLTAWTAILLLVLAGVLSLADGVAASPSTAAADSAKSVWFTTQTFIGAPPLEPNFTGVKGFLVFFTRLAGFGVLGLWLGLAANSVGRLSAD